ncbi:MAG: Ger(x)C family spore germination protein [Bacillota bacterium]|nr:Ger(x)C family spore germination protein [Bacillota bacterium]
MKALLQKIPALRGSSPLWKWRRLLPLFILPLLLSGCVRAAEINDLSVFSGLALDREQESGGYRVWAELVTSYEGQESSDETLIAAAAGDTLSQAVTACAAESSGKSHWGHMSALVLSPGAAEQGIEPLLEHFLHNSQYRLSMDLLLFDGEETEEVWELQTDSGGIGAYDYSELLLRSRELSTAAPVKLCQAAEILNTPGIELTVPVLTADGEDRAVLSGAGVFLDDRLTGFLSQEELLPLLFLQNKVETATLSLPALSAAAELVESSTHISFTEEDAELMAAVSIRGRLRLSETAGDGLSSQSLSRLEEAFEEEVERQCALLVQRVQSQLRSDVFGFGLALSKETPERWEPLCQSWNLQSFPLLKATIECEFTLEQGQ